MIDIKGITKSFGSLQVLKGIDLHIERGEVVSIVGPSGAGKTTLLQIIGTLDHPDSGSIVVNGINVGNLSTSKLSDFRNTHLGFVFQSFHLIQSLSVAENVELPLLYRKMGRHERKQRVHEVLERVGLSHRMRHFPNQLSGGQCQRVAIARAVVGNPKILLADEPTGNLDTKMGHEVMTILQELHAQDGRTVVMVTHNEEQARQTERIIRFLDGVQVA